MFLSGVALNETYVSKGLLCVTTKAMPNYKLKTWLFSKSFPP